MKLKMIIGILFLIMFINGVVALDVDDFTFPSQLTKTGDGLYNDGTGQNILVVEYSDDNKEMWLTPSETNIIQEKENNTYQFEETSLDEYGWIEIIEHNGDKYIVVSWTPNTDDSTYQEATLDNLIKFNQLNNIKPIAI